jgi:glycosyltransferase involved in cell wall biosynthesis
MRSYTPYTKGPLAERIKDMFMSLIICTKNRASQLQQCLKEIADASIPPCELEVVLVDNGSEDSTNGVIKDFVETSSLKVEFVDCKNPGLGLARNVGVSASKGEWLLFTDDDCYIEKTFFLNFFNFTKMSSAFTEGEKQIRYGSGPIDLYDKKHDPRVANLVIEKVKLIPPNSLMPAGVIQGANMFFHRSIFQNIGNFNEKMGSGTPFACEDIEMAARASFAGFLGAQVPFFKVIHHHKRLIGSVEANVTVESYDYGRGAYYASLIDKGFPQVWRLWEACSHLQNIRNVHVRMQLVRELEGAAKYLNALR